MYNRLMYMICKYRLNKVEKYRARVAESSSAHQFNYLTCKVSYLRMILSYYDLKTRKW